MIYYLPYPYILTYIYYNLNFKSPLYIKKVFKALYNFNDCIVNSRFSTINVVILFKLVVDVYQDWCGPSNTLFKVLESVQPKLFSNFLFKSVNKFILNFKCESFMDKFI